MVGPPPPPGTETAGQATARLIAEWRGCLNVEDFITLRFGEVWANKGSNRGNCEVCHSTGAYGMYANDDNTEMYNVLSGSREYMLFFFAADVSNVATADGDQRRALHHARPADPAAPGAPGVRSDPGDRWRPRRPLDVLQQLYDLTMARKLAVPTTCGPPITN